MCREYNSDKRVEGPVTISIIAPIYGVEQYIEDFADSVLSQSYPYVEFIFVNDVSATLHEAEKYINLKSLAKITGIRNDILKQYASGKRIPKSEQEARIIKGIHEIADKLLEII